LSPVVVESEGLMAALKALATDTEELFDVKCRFVNKAPVLIHDHAVATHLYRIAQEAITNSIKHGRAKHIDVSLFTKADRTLLTIEDDGGGFGQPSANNGAGMGLRTMRYRAGLIGATLVLQQVDSGGVAVICSLPQAAK